MLVRCLYASRAVVPLADGTLEAIFKQARKHNPAHGITGMLAHANDVFVQAIEGGRGDVSQLLSNLYKDARHTGVEILSFEEITERQFGHWTMGQVKLASVSPVLLLKYSEKAVLNPFTCNGAATMALLMEIAASGAIVNRNA